MDRFTVSPAAGELATGYGLTGWNEGEAIIAAKTCFDAWLEGFGGTGDREQRALLEHVRAFFEAHGKSCFEHYKAPHDQRIQNRAGFYRDDATGKREYLVLQEAFKHKVCQGFDQKFAIRTLLNAGWLIPGTDGRPTQKIYISRHGQLRCHVLNSKMWDGE